MTTGLDRTYHVHRCILVSHFNFFVVSCGGLSWLPVTYYCTLNTHYRIVFVSYLLQVRVNYCFEKYEHVMLLANTCFSYSFSFNLVNDMKRIMFVM